MIVTPKGLQRREPCLKHQKNRRREAGQVDLPHDIYEAYLVIFRDLGIELIEADDMDRGHSLLLVSPAGASMLVSSDTSRDEKVFACAHALGHVVLGHGRGRKWFTLEDHAQGARLDPQYGDFNEDADAMARALLHVGCVPAPMKNAAFRWVLRTGRSAGLIRGAVQQLQKLHFAAWAYAPPVNSAIKKLPYMQSLWQSGRAYLLSEPYGRSLDDSRRE